jgi:hypothetical protein
MTDGIQGYVADDIKIYIDSEDCSIPVTITRKRISKVTVVSNGFTCEMTADQFFKIIHEAHQW